MQNWDEGRHGQAPQEGDPEYIELLEPYECEHVYQDITLSLPTITEQQETPIDTNMSDIQALFGRFYAGRPLVVESRSACRG